MHRQTEFEGAGAGNVSGSGSGSGSDGNRRSASSLSSNTGTGIRTDAHAAEEIMHEAPAAGMNPVAGAVGQTQAAQIMMFEHAHVHARQLQLHQHQHNMLQVQQHEQRHQLHHDMSELSSQLGRLSPQHDRYILNSLQHLQIMQQQHQHHQGLALPLQVVGLPQQGHAGMPRQQSHPSAGGLGGGAMVLTTTRPNLDFNFNTFSATNAATREAQIQHHQEEEALDKKRLAVLIEEVCAKNAPNYPPPPVEVFAGACQVEESNVTSYDVLAGRGNRVNKLVGNIRFRELVKPFKVQYLQNTTRKLTKTQMRAVLVKYVRTCSTHVVPQGRFLKKDPHTQLWVEIGDKKAREKAGQALREDATVIRAELGIAKPGTGAAMTSSKEAEALSKTGSTDTNNKYESPPAKKKEEEETETATASIDKCASPPQEEPSFAAAGNKDAPHAAEEEDEETENKSGLVDHRHCHVSSPATAAAAATWNIPQEDDAAARNISHQEDFKRRRVASVPLNLALDMGIPPIRSSKSMFHLNRRNTIHTPDGANSSMKMNMAFAARRDSSSSMAMMSSANAVMGNLAQSTTTTPRNVQVDLLEEQEQCQASAAAAAQYNDEQELLLKQKLRLLMSQRKHKPGSQRNHAGTCTPSPMEGLRMLKREPSFKRGSESSDGSFDLPLTLTAGESVSVRYSNSSMHNMGVVSNVNITAAGPGPAAGRANLLHAYAGSSTSSSGKYPNNGSVPRMDVSNRTIQESLVKHAMEGSDGDCDGHGDSLDSEQEEQTSRLYSKTPSKQRLIQKQESKNILIAAEDKDVLVASAVAALACGHQRGSSSGGNSIDNHNASIRPGGGDQTRDQESMFDSSMAMSSHLGNSNSALSSTNWNSHGNMSMVDFSFSQVLHELADGFWGSDVENDADVEEEEHGHGEQKEEYARKPQSVRPSAVATAATSGAAGTGAGAGVDGSESLNQYPSVGYSMPAGSLSVASLAHSFTEYEHQHVTIEQHCPPLVELSLNLTFLK
jgi:hypothetical protein